MAAKRLRISPANPVAKRLEQVRKSLGFDSFREYHLTLNERSGGDDVHYNSAREYHVNRTVPVSYVAKVHEAFGASIDWIISGDGETWEGEEAHGPKDGLAFESFVEQTAPEFSFASDAFASSLFRDVAKQLVESCPDAGKLSDAERARLYGLLSDLVLDPIRRVGVDPTPDRLRSYQIAALSAVMHAIPDRGRGRPARALLSEYDEQPSKFSPWADRTISPELFEDAPEFGGGRFLFGDEPSAASVVEEEEVESVPVESLSPADEDHENDLLAGEAPPPPPS
jgi:hypothetical protein